jgi:myo-inositol 2-dehydrogenase / D-chiro-inositol 1-dehydrogenase
MEKITRRHALASATAGLLIVRPETAFSFQANSAVTLGIIGVGSRGRYVGGSIFAKDPRVKVVAICDVQPSSIDLAKTQVPGADQARVFTDHQELLAAPGIDCVYIATPIFLHPEHFEHAVTARKHIYCEKAAAADVAGVKRILRAGERADKTKHIQWGFQQRYGPEYLAAEKIVSSGQLGELLMMRSHWMVSGVTPTARPRPAYSSLAEEKLRNWYNWKETCGDFIVEQDCHGVDVLNWYAKSHPLTASGAGGKKLRPYGDCNDHANITYEYANGLRGCLHGCQFAQGWSMINEQFFGTNGTVETSRQNYRWSRTAPARAVEDVKSKREPTFDAVEYFLDHVVGSTPENRTVDAAESTMTAMMGRMAVETRRVITWDEMLRSA